MVSLTQKLKNLPEKPGVYLFKNSKGEVLYVGKAKNLKNRIRSYFPPHPSLPHQWGGIEGGGRTELMVSQIANFDYTIVSTETESLILENNFIKQFRPRYNVRLRDDKNYQFIKIDYETEIPQIYPVRRIELAAKNLKSKITNLKSRYFGPFTSGLSVKRTLKLVREIFRLCSNKKLSDRACFYYHIGRCDGVCIGKVSPSKYRLTLHQVEDFLANRQGEILRHLKEEMTKAAAKQKYEQAGNLRDRVFALKSIWEKQKIVFTIPVSEDLLSLHKADSQAIINLFAIRNGKMIRQEIFELYSPPGTPETQILESFVLQYYTEATDLPKTVIAPSELQSKEKLKKMFKFKVVSAKRGKRYQLLKLGVENAQDYYNKNQASSENAVQLLAKSLNLGEINRIECYDISNIQGFLPVGSMVVFEKGEPKKSDYRKFKIQTKATPDDFAMMKEVISRRFKRGSTSPLPSPGLGREPSSESEKGERSKEWPIPDLIVIDGGKGQLSAALEVLTIYNLQLPIIGLAKRLEEIYIPGRKTPLRLPEDSPALHLLQRIRDEAHRFAITFYRGRHKKELTKSQLSQISGVGPVMRRKLLKRFGSVSGIRSASLEALASEVGLSLAKKIKENL